MPPTFGTPGVPAPAYAYPAAVTPPAGSPAWNVKWRKGKNGGGSASSENYGSFWGLSGPLSGIDPVYASIIHASPGSPGSYPSVPLTVAHPATIKATFKNLRGRCFAAPGGQQQFEVTLFKGGLVTLLKLTFNAAGGVNAQDLSNPVLVNPGDLIEWEFKNTGVGAVDTDFCLLTWEEVPA